jgi:hypothetical protein
MLYISKTKNLLLDFFLYLTSIHRYQLPIFFYHAFRGHLYTGVPELPLQRKKGCRNLGKYDNLNFEEKKS